eukprot:CAMPEP_0197003870 /NCGR_PEP_ID=MMETSP1380-20130617/15071_1 /TAXON_ID=5936 /ORGANISM="Euplotes crassus, Strain CT5" /LENGTH=129 /DNA_ID=CAMNT_0042422485 /DNA_START=35 /DNA_END=424 /DNA_ORIENTATION=+
MAKSVELKTQDFLNGKVSNNKGDTTDTWIVKFFNPGCPHCKRFAKDWDDVANKLTDQGVNYGHVNCVKERPACERFNIWGVPTVLVFKDNHLEEYQGSYDYDSLSKYIINRNYDTSGLSERAAVPQNMY